MLIQLHCVASQVPQWTADLSYFRTTLYWRPELDATPELAGVQVVPLAPLRRLWETPLIGRVTRWRLTSERSRLDFLLIRNAVRNALKFEPSVQHVLAASLVDADLFLARRVAEDLGLPVGTDGFSGSDTSLSVGRQR